MSFLPLELNTRKCFHNYTLEIVMEDLAIINGIVFTTERGGKKKNIARADLRPGTTFFSLTLPAP